MRKLIPAAVLAVVLPLAACNTMDDAAAGSVANAGLAGTQWKLVSYTPAGDSMSKSYPRADGRYVLEFEPGGRLNATLDCNRGTASWSEGIANATGGTLSVSQIASTRALCAAPDMGELLAGRLPAPSRYRIADNTLVLTLGSDGETMEFVAE